MRYHSIVVDKLPEDFEVTARTVDDGEIMAIQQRRFQSMVYNIIQNPLAHLKD